MFQNVGCLTVVSELLIHLVNLDSDVEDPESEVLKFLLSPPKVILVTLLRNLNVPPKIQQVHAGPAPREVSSPQSSIICVHGYKVNIYATILEAIFKKHGDIAATCVFTDAMRTCLLEVVCDIVRQIETNDVHRCYENIFTNMSMQNTPRHRAGFPSRYIHSYPQNHSTSQPLVFTPISEPEMQRCNPFICYCGILCMSSFEGKQ